jgi:basic amino acid/polyamine antiporter, APA family
VHSLARRLRLIDYFSLAFGTMIGTGWLVVMDDWLIRGGPAGAILGFLIGGAMLFPIGYVYGKLVMAMPDAGGEVAYTAKVFPRSVSFAAGWTMLLSYFVVCPYEAVAAAKIAGYMFPSLNSMELYRVGGKPVFLPHLMVGLLVAALVTAMNYRGIRLSASFQTWTTLSVIFLGMVFASAGFGHGSIANLEPLFRGDGQGSAFISILLIVQIVPFFMEGFESVGKSAEEAEAGFAGHRFFLAIGLAIVVGILFYVMVIGAVAYAAPRQSLLNESFATAVALEKAVGSHWIGSLIMATALLSVLKCFNGNMVAASRMFFALGRRGLVHPGVAYVHPQNRTPSVAVIWVGLATALIVLGGQSILVPIAEVGSVTAAVGWMAACASFVRMKPPTLGQIAAVVGLLVTAVLVLMKLIPSIPGHFTVYEWIAVAIWGCLGLLLHRRSQPETLANAA